MKKDQKIYIKEDGVRFRKPSDAPEGVENMSKGQEVVFVDGPWSRVTELRGGKPPRFTGIA